MLESCDRITAPGRTALEGVANLKRTFRVIALLSIASFCPFGFSSYAESSKDVVLNDDQNRGGKDSARNYSEDINKLVNNETVNDVSISPPKKLRIFSKIQRYDAEKNTFIATGDASALLEGYIIKADNIQFSNDFNSVFAYGRVRLKKGSHFFQASLLKYDLIKKKGYIENVYGVLDIKRLANDKDFKRIKSSEDSITFKKDKTNSFIEDHKYLPLPSYFSIYTNKNIPIELIDQNIDHLKRKDSLALEISIGGSQKSSDSISFNDRVNKYRPDRFISGGINRWRMQANKLFLDQNIWTADRISFSNDPLTPAQSRIEALNVIAKEDNDGNFIIQSKKSKLIFEEKLRVPFIKNKTIRDQEIENKWILGFDSKDRDGFYLGYNMDEIHLAKKYSIFLQPQFLLQRSLSNGTNSYTKSDEPIYNNKTFTPNNVQDLFGLKFVLKGEQYGWNIDLNSDISTFNINRFSHANRYWVNLERDLDSPFLKDSSINLFGAYRYRVWNGSLGENDIYSAYGGFLQKKGNKVFKNANFGYILRLGTGNYLAESLGGGDLSSLWRGSIYGSINTNYPIWKGNSNILPVQDKYRYSSVPISSSLYLNTTIDSSYFMYEDGSYQQTIGIKSGPILTLGNFSKKFLDYTKFAFQAGFKAKEGKSPFEFDEVVDLSTLSIGLTQQIYGPLLLSTEFDFNIDSSSTYYGKVIKSRISAMWRRRSYDISLYYSPHRVLGGLKIRLHDFSFDGAGIPFVPDTKRDLDKPLP